MFHRFTAFIAAAVIALPAGLSSANEPAGAASSAKEVWFSADALAFNGGEPVRGADISSIISLEESGVKFYNEIGQEQDIFLTLAENGVNYIRVRVWNEPYDDMGRGYGGGNCDLEKAKLIAARASKYGLKLLVDIHYSDFWADPSRQTRPKYWAPHDHDKLKGEIYAWTSWVVKSIDEAGGDIGMVQIGNETSCLFCDEDDMYKICDLFSSANKAIRDYDRNILIAHHFPNPASGHYEWYAKVMDECKLDYDIFATSYYPYWHGSISNLTSVLKTIGDRYGKYVMVAETAYPYTDEDGDAFGNSVTSYNKDDVFSYDISVDGQIQSVIDVFQAVADTGHGIGAFYWEPAWIGRPDLSPAEQRELWNKYGSGWASDYAASYDKNVTEAGGSSFDNQALFDFYGKPLPSLSVFNNVYPRKERVFPKKGAETPDGVYRLKNSATGKYLTVLGGVGLNGNRVSQYEADGAADYNTWRVEATKDGYYNIYSCAGGCGLGGVYDVTLCLPDDAGEVKFVKADDGSCYIVEKNGGDVFAFGPEDGSDGGVLRRGRLASDRNQRWILEPVEEAYLKGDLDGDGRIDSFDAALMRSALIEGEKPKSGDANDDGEFGVADVVTLYKAVLGDDVDLRWGGTPKNTIFPRAND